ncbi:unnamed protein product [Clonostachys rosea]|uniref:Uncharacterized protein n=1 Tax=Bionectria ochroleuca TaxID=29856 RepID=A0ABY6U830_BIOOC|nr:unnamed protein product [Clonostachys rosea]
MASQDIDILDTDDPGPTAHESTFYLKRSPTASSYYDFDGMPWDGEQGQSWMYAWHARAQQEGLLPSSQPRSSQPTGFRSVARKAKTLLGSPHDPKYPSYYGNKGETLPLSTDSELIPHPTWRRSTKGWLHQPLIPGRTATFSGTEDESGMVRSFYAPSNPLIFDVAYHGKKKEFINGKSEIGKFKMATYHPAVKQVDEILLAMTKII